MVKIVSDVKGFQGYVITPDYMNIQQVRAFEDAFFGDLAKLSEEEKDRRVFVSVSDERLIPFLLDFVTEWHIKNVPEEPTLENFPQTPRRDAHALISEISQGIFEMWRGEVEVPNE